MIVTKLWNLCKRSLSDYDIEQLRLLNCAVEIVSEERRELHVKGTVVISYCISPGYLKITTTCEKQEIVLKLLFGDQLYLVETFTGDIIL